MAVQAGLRIFFDVNDDLVDYKDLIGRKGADDGPEDGNGCAENGDIDFKNAENVYDWRVVRHVDDGDSAGAVDAERDHATDRYGGNTER